MTRSLSAAALMLLLAGCSAREPELGSRAGMEEVVTITGADGTVAGEMRLRRENYVSKNSVNATPAAVFAVLPAVFESVGLPAPEIDPSQGIAVVQPFTVTRRLGDVRMSTLLDCGRGPAGLYADSYRIHLSLVTQVTAEGTSGSTILTRLDAIGQNTGGTSGNARCSTSGQLEASIVDAVREATG